MPRSSSNWRRTALAAVVLGAAAPSFASAETIRAGGTGAATEMLKRLGAAFAKDDPDITVVVIPSLGSTGGINAVADGLLQLSVSGRALKPEESAKGLSEMTLARTPFALATSHPRPNGLMSAAAAAFFADDKAVWGDGTPVRVILRPKSDSDTEVLGRMLPGMRATIEKLRARSDLPVAATDQDNATMAEQVPGSLTASTYTQVMTERRNLRLVAIDGVEPTLENYETGAYPYGKELHFIFPAQKSPAVERFIAFLRSSEGGRVLRETGCLPSLDPHGLRRTAL